VNKNLKSNYLELAVSAPTQERLRYIEGDRVIAHFDEQNKSWILERISSDRVADGYKVRVQQLANGLSTVTIRLGCTEEQAKAVIGDSGGLSYDFLELTGNRACFVLSE
jgi:hypothetical protein